MKIACWTAAAAIAAAPVVAEADPVLLYAAGSLRTALGEVAEDFASAYDAVVLSSFGPSGPMRERIEGGETTHVFVSANMGHPRTLEEAGRPGRSFCAEPALCIGAAGDLRDERDPARDDARR